MAQNDDQVLKEEAEAIDDFSPIAGVLQNDDLVVSGVNLHIPRMFLKKGLV